MIVEHKSAIASVIDIIIRGVNRKKHINVIYKEAHDWVETVRSAQADVFGEALTLPLTEDHVRKAITWIHKHKKR
jgi:hypothetical protein